MMEPIPFRTDDAILAFALYIAGVPFFRPPTNSFTEIQLKRLGLGGISVLDAAKAAWKRKDRGSVEYWFEKTPELPHFLKAYKDQCEVIDRKEAEDGGEHLRGIMAKAANVPVQIDEREALLRIAVVVLKGRIPFVNQWKDSVPFLKLPEAGETKDLGNDTTQFPGFKLVPVNSSPEQLAKLGL